MKHTAKIKVPRFINEMKDHKGNPYFSFLYNISVKNKQTGEYEISERYSINVMNIFIEPDMEIQITKILEAKPQIFKDKKGREYLNCIMWVEADNLTKDNTYIEKVNNPGMRKKKNNDNEEEPSSRYVYDDNLDDLPF